MLKSLMDWENAQMIFFLTQRSWFIEHLLEQLDQVNKNSFLNTNQNWYYVQFSIHWAEWGGAVAGHCWGFIYMNFVMASTNGFKLD